MEELLTLKEDDLKVIKSLVENRYLSISSIAREIYDIDSRLELTNKINYLEYRLNKMVEEGIMGKIREEGQILYGISGTSAWICNLKGTLVPDMENAEMAKKKIDHKMLFIKKGDYMILISL